jgi:nicotinic acid phosphoribosyltransferase
MASRKVRKALDAHGMESVSILGSGALQESTVLDLTRKSAPVDLYAIGRELALGDRQSEFTLSYRIAEMWRGAELELVTRRGASLYPGMKQLMRGPKGDLLCLEDELELLDLQGFRALLVPLLREGQRIRDEDSVEGVRDRLQRELSVLPEEVLDLESPGHWPVQPSDRLARAALS